MLPDAAWRTAAEAWLQMKDYITVGINGTVSPFLLLILAS
jgi:hypothetical protein